jgi:hypothetical protein
MITAGIKKNRNSANIPMNTEMAEFLFAKNLIPRRSH